MSRLGFPQRVNGPLNDDPGSDPDIQNPPPKGPSFRTILQDEESEEAESEGSEESAGEG